MAAGMREGIANPEPVLSHPLVGVVKPIWLALFGVIMKSNLGGCSLFMLLPKSLQGNASETVGARTVP